jgi:aspartate racemase
MSSQFHFKPLSFAQERLWYLAQLEPKNPTYNVSVAYRIIGLLDESLLERSLGEMSKRHEILRTTFPLVDEEPKQVILPEINFTLERVDLQKLPREQQKIEVRQQASQTFFCPSGMRIT